ncbi:uncharacterized protein LOC135384392 [Ornithodoros turicata]|uniref:uncharacterized protein LOC135384392 n=1 Tax=Ornithodoros turicata TaxID=34597 RepID=UPI003138BFDE
MRTMLDTISSLLAPGTGQGNGSLGEAKGSYSGSHFERGDQDEDVLLSDSMHEESIFSESCAVEAVSSGSCMRQPQLENLVHSGRSAMGDRDQPRDFCHANQTVTAAIAAEPPGKGMS